MMESWFYLMLLIGITLPMWTAIGAIEVAIICLDMLVALFWGNVPAVTYPLILLLNVFMLVKAVFYRPLYPNIGGS